MKTDRIWRALSVALALCLTLALAPTCAFAADADTEPVEDGVSTSGVTDVTGGSGVRVKTEVRNNYTDTYQRQTVTLVNGTATVEDDFSGLDGRNLTFADLGVLTLQAAYDGGARRPPSPWTPAAASSGSRRSSSTRRQRWSARRR